MSGSLLLCPTEHLIYANNTHVTIVIIGTLSELELCLSSGRSSSAFAGLLFAVGCCWLFFFATATYTVLQPKCKIMLITAFCLLLTAFCLLLTAYSLQSIAS
jgi:hypothetical protein